jgi:hypothetical protein
MTLNRQFSRTCRIAFGVGLTIVAVLILVINRDPLVSLVLLVLVQVIDDLWWDAVEKPMEEDEQENGGI